MAVSHQDGNESDKYCNSTTNSGTEKPRWRVGPPGGRGGRIRVHRLAAAADAGGRPGAAGAGRRLRRAAPDAWGARAGDDGHAAGRELLRPGGGGPAAG